MQERSVPQPDSRADQLCGLFVLAHPFFFFTAVILAGRGRFHCALTGYALQLLRITTAASFARESITFSQSDCRSGTGIGTSCSPATLSSLRRALGKAAPDSDTPFRAPARA